MVTLEPTSAFTSVDLPTLGAPISATNPQRVDADAASFPTSAVIVATRYTFAFQHLERRELLRGAFAAAHAFGRRQAWQFDRHAELRIMMRSGALDFTIDRRGQAP